LYAVKKDLAKEPDWYWVEDMILDNKEYERMIYVIQTARAFVPKYKFGVEVPRSIRHALEIDKRNGNNLWRRAIEKELKQMDDFQVFRLPREGEDLSDTLPYGL
ncbi:hypothetical protein, partial [Salmonella enterica]|uniref:hypothetical protein n=1 Tax=Salmonella enterica TaxID=28901 RepID=UPI003523A5DF